MSFIQQLWQKLHSPFPLVTEPSHWCRQGPWLILLSISDTLALRGMSQCDTGLANKKQAEGAGWGLPERLLGGRFSWQASLWSYILYPSPYHFPEYDTMSTRGAAILWEEDKVTCQGQQSQRGEGAWDTLTPWRYSRPRLSPDFLSCGKKQPLLVCTLLKFLLQATNLLPDLATFFQLSMRH